jgi:hypothetical protein
LTEFKQNTVDIASVTVFLKFVWFLEMIVMSDPTTTSTGSKYARMNILGWVAECDMGWLDDQGLKINKVW